MHYLKKEALVRSEFNKQKKMNSKKERLTVGSGIATHEFDIYEADKVIAGISTSPWKNKSGTNNTGGQDRAAAEIFWLSIWVGKEDRSHILTDAEMASKIFQKFSGISFLNEVEILHFDMGTNSFSSKGFLG